MLKTENNTSSYKFNETINISFKINISLRTQSNTSSYKI